MFRQTPQSMVAESAIGTPPGGYIRVTPINRPHLRDWLIAQGIPALSANKALDSSIAKAYGNSAYLASWRTRGMSNYSFTPDNAPAAKLEGLDDETFSAEVPREKSAAEIFPTEAESNIDSTASSLASAIESKLRLDDKIRASVAREVQKTGADLAATFDRKIADQLSKVEIELKPSAIEKIKQLARDEGRRVFDEWLPPKRIEIIVNDFNLGEIDLQHEKFPDLLRACSARDVRGFGLNVWLTGPTGSGKTFGAEQVAKLTSRDFYCDSSLDADYKVLGFRDAHGTFQETPFYRAYSNGGVYCLDEIDNWSPSALLSVNAGLASGFQTFANGEMVQRNPNLTIIACANTWGLGATNDYVGRTKLDAATLDRFFPKIDWQIDERLELEISGRCDQISWCETVQSARKRAREMGLKVIISPRATYNGIALFAAGFSQPEVEAMTIYAGLSDEQRLSLSGVIG